VQTQFHANAVRQLASQDIFIVVWQPIHAILLHAQVAVVQPQPPHIHARKHALQHVPIKVTAQAAAEAVVILEKPILAKLVVLLRHAAVQVQKLHAQILMQHPQMLEKIIW
jgi:hypothetical protein